MVAGSVLLARHDDVMIGSVEGRAHANGRLTASWKPQEEQAGLDSEGRLIDAAIARQKLASFGQEPLTGVVSSYQKAKKQEPQRLPFSLSSLQVLAGKRYGYEPQLVLDTAQKLYERKLTTYPRSDCEYLPLNQLPDAKAILQNLAGVDDEQLAGWAAGSNGSIKSRAWNDKKISAHHAIIPTTVRVKLAGLSETERNIYFLVAQAYIAQFYPVHTYDQTKIGITYKEELFTASGRVVRDMGWKQLYAANPEKDEEEEDASSLPAMTNYLNNIIIPGAVAIQPICIKLLLIIALIDGTIQISLDLVSGDKVKFLVMTALKGGFFIFLISNWLGVGPDGLNIMNSLSKGFEEIGLKAGGATEGVAPDSIAKNGVAMFTAVYKGVPGGIMNMGTLMVDLVALFISLACILLTALEIFMELSAKPAFTSIDMSAILEDEAPEYRKTAELLQQRTGTQLSAGDCAMVRGLAEAILVRSARLVTATYAGIIWHLAGAGKVARQHIAIDGSVYEKMPLAKENVLKALYDILGEDAAQVDTVLEGGGSGLGAAIAAAMSQKA